MNIQKQWDLLLQKENSDPHQFLGMHDDLDKKIVRIFRPKAKEVFLKIGNDLLEAKKVNEEGLFVCEVPQNVSADEYLISDEKKQFFHDPYSFSPIISKKQIQQFKRGTLYRLYDVLGAHEVEQNQVRGIKFSLWALSAKSVYLVGDFNDWDENILPMRNMLNSGIWELFVPQAKFEEKYQFCLYTKDNEKYIKTDPMAFYHEKRPKQASITFDLSKMVWEDEKWLEKRKNTDLISSPMNVYEVHLGSWKKKNNEFPNYREIAIDLAKYCKRMHFTHVEILPIKEHPLDESWGYQVSGYFAPTSRFGTPLDFQYFINHLHKNDIGVIFDFVSAHFPTDEHSLYKFDGSCLYEYDDPIMQKHPLWTTHIFDYRKKEVQNFLIASAFFWAEKMHIDGFRIDAVSSLLFLDYERKNKPWKPNKLGGNHNLEAIAFLKKLNKALHKSFPDIVTIAEESKAFKNVTAPLSKGGLGFDMKWNMGWMSDTLKFFSKPHDKRSSYHDDLTFPFVYTFHDKHVLALSHDEVAFEKKSLFMKMPGSDEEKFSDLKLLYSYMICHPGKKLTFMGNELAQREEWDCKEQISWHLTDEDFHGPFHKFVSEINAFYKKREELWEKDFQKSSLKMIDSSDHKNQVISYIRKGKNSSLFCVHNFSNQHHKKYFIPLKGVKNLKEIFHTDHEKYGGKHHILQKPNFVVNRHYNTFGCYLSIPALSTIIYEVEFG